MPWYILILCIYHSNDPLKHTSYSKQWVSNVTHGDATPYYKDRDTFIFYIYLNNEPPKHTSDSKQWHVSSGAQLCGGGDAEPPASGGPTDAAQRTGGGWIMDVTSIP